MSRSSRISGYLLIGTGVIHNLVGLILGYSVLVTIGKAGIVNSVDGHFDRMAVFWFLFSGFGIMMCGDLLMRMKTTPPTFAWSLLTLSLLGVVMIPISGFWIVIPQAVYMLVAKRPTQET